MIFLLTYYYTLNHSILINRLANAGFTGNALDWLKSYITDRNSCVSIDDKRSLDIPLEHGIPQGSVLGPILFNICIAPLFAIIDIFPNISFHSYADDIQIYIRASNPNDPFTCSLLRECLGKISNWCKQNSLMLNESKSNDMFINLKKV